MNTPETPNTSAENLNEQPRNYQEVVQRAKQAGKYLESLRTEGASAEQLQKAEREAALWLNVAMGSKLAGTIESDEPKPPRYETVLA